MSNLPSRTSTNNLAKNIFWHKDEFLKKYGNQYELLFDNAILIKDADVFNTYKNANLIYSRGQNGPIAISQDLIIDLLSNDELFFILLNNINRNLDLAFNIVLFDMGTTINNIYLYRSDLFYVFNALTDLTPKVKMRIAIINSRLGKESLSEHYLGYTHETIIDNEEYHIPVETIIEILTLKEEDFQSFIAGTKKYPYPKEQMAYMVVDFIQRERIIPKYVLPYSVLKRYKELADYSLIDYETLDKLQKTNDADVDGTSIINKISLDENFYQMLFQGCNPQYSPLEKAIYIYIKLCELLTYDQEYFSSNQKNSINDQNDIYALKQITATNNAVSEQQFIYIYAKIVKDLGLSFSLMNTNRHFSLKIRFGEFLVDVQFDPSINNDLARAKIGDDLLGLTSTNTNATTTKRFNEIYAKVVNEMKHNRIAETAFTMNLLTYQVRYSEGNLTLKERLQILFKLVSEANNVGVDSLYYQNKIFDILFGDNENIAINFISSSLHSYHNLSYTPITVISIKNNNDYVYYIIDANNPRVINRLNAEELMEMFEMHNYAYIKESDKPIPGLFLQRGGLYYR